MRSLCGQPCCVYPWDLVAGVLPLSVLALLLGACCFQNERAWSDFGNPMPAGFSAVDARLPGSCS